MSGRRALQFVRSRHGTNGEGSDFARSKRQLKVLLALKEKLLSFKTLTNPLRMTAIMGTLESHITTNVALSDMVTLAKLAREFNTDEIITLTLENGPNGLLQSGTGQNGAYILSPKTGNFRQIRNAIDNIFEDTELASIETNTTPTQVAPPEHTAAIQLLNGTWKVGLASRTKQRLIDKKFTVASIGNTSERPLPKSGIYAPASLQYQDTITALEQTLDIPSFSYYPPGMSPTAGADVIVILGEDYSE